MAESGHDNRGTRAKRNWGKLTVVCPVCETERQVSKNSLYITKLPNDALGRTIRKCRSCSKREHYATWFSGPYVPDHSITRRQEQRVWCIRYLGGACGRCRYAYDGQNAPAFDFHHRDPAQKDFVISGRRYSRERVRAELDKCELLCAICHRLEHANRY